MASMLPRAEFERLPYRRNVGVVLVNGDGLIWSGRRADGFPNAWQMPQGGIDAGEDSRAAALRELQEETGVAPANVNILRESPDWLRYDLPQDLVPKLWGGRFRGQEQKWFLLRYLGSDSEIDIETEHQEFVEWRWMSASELSDIVVPFKRDVYDRVLGEFSRWLAA